MRVRAVAVHHEPVEPAVAYRVDTPDGSVVVWVVDDKGEGLASVHVTRRMKHVRINADCARIDAN